MLGDKISLAVACKSEAVHKEEAEDHKDGAKNAPPKLLVHHSLRLLFAVDEVFHGEVKRIQSPYVERGERAS